MSYSEQLVFGSAVGNFREGCHVHASDESLFIGIMSLCPKRPEIRAWRKGNIRCGVFTEETVPIFLIEISGVLGITLNLDFEGKKFKRYRPQRGIDSLFELFLCEIPSGIIKVYYTCRLDAGIRDSFRDKSEQAKRNLGDNYISEIYRVLQRYPALEMIGRTSMHKCRLLN